MKAIIPAAGYATRLRPLTNTRAKQLLPIGGRPMIDYIVDAIDEVDDVDELHVVTNSHYAAAFRRWVEERDGRLRPQLHDDGTTSNETRLGAIGDLRFVLDEAGLRGEHLLVVAGDNLFDFTLRDYVAFWRSKGVASCVALYRVPDRALASQYGIVELDADDRIVSFVEKPEDPPSDLAATAAYLVHRAHAALVDSYLEEGNSPDAPGNFIAWLHKREPVYGYRFEGEWLDIGSATQLLEADNLMRDRNGLPLRAEYDPEPAQV